MVFKNFRLNIAVRALLLTLSAFVLSFIALNSSSYATILFLSAVIVVQVVSLIRYQERIGKDLKKFLSSIKYDDFSRTYPLSGYGKTFDELNNEFNKVIKRFQEVRTNKETDYQYLKTVVQHVGIGIIAFDASGSTQIVNIAAKRLFSVNRLDNINELKKYSEELVLKMVSLHTGGRDLVKIRINDDVVQLAVFAIELTLRGKDFKLITFQNIRSELEEKEMEAWQNLIRVLTHEIMNSVTPISSLASTVDDEVVAHMKSGKEKPDFSREDLEDIHMAIETIKRRSEGLIRFVTDFRNLTKVPVPIFSVFRVSEMTDQILLLMKYELNQKGIDFKVHIEPKTLTITADRELIEQVLINMIQNAVHAVEEMPEKLLEIKAFQDTKGRTAITVRDTGAGIDPEVIERIFIPFFTTKQRGSGIGLSLSRQIMRQHKGAIGARSEPGNTVFTLRF